MSTGVDCSGFVAALVNCAGLLALALSGLWETCSGYVLQTYEWGWRLRLIVEAAPCVLLIVGAALVDDAPPQPTLPAPQDPALSSTAGSGTRRSGDPDNAASTPTQVTYNWHHYYSEYTSAPKHENAGVSETAAVPVLPLTA
jgi:hypothetical protein